MRLQTCKNSGTGEPNSQTLLKKNPINFRNQSFKDINFKRYSDIVKILCKLVSIQLYLYMKRQNTYSYNPKSDEYVQINCPAN